MPRLLAFSDMHMSRRCAAEIRAASADADLVIGAGDFCNTRQGLDEAMEMLWTVLDKAVLVPGNAESAEELRAAAPEATVLHGEGCDRAGLAIFGLGYAVPETPFGSWSCDLSETTATIMLSKMTHADLMIVHSPPKGIADRARDGRSLGSAAIRDAIARVQPRLVVCGHIHDSWGKSGTIGASPVHNLGPRANWFDL